MYSVLSQSYLLTQVHSSLCTKFSFLLLYPKTHLTLTLLEDFLPSLGKSRGSPLFLSESTEASFNSQFTNIRGGPRVVNSALCSHSPYAYIYCSKSHARYHYLFTCLEGAAWRQTAMWIVWLRQWHYFLFLQTHPTTVTSALCLWAQPRTPRALAPASGNPREGHIPVHCLPALYPLPCALVWPTGLGFYLSPSDKHAISLLPWNLCVWIFLLYLAHASGKDLFQGAPVVKWTCLPLNHLITCWWLRTFQLIL